MKHYGIPYQGSKEKILDLIRYIFERESNKKYYIDPFCGGFSVCAYALENTGFTILANDLNKYVIALYREILFNKAQNFKKVQYEWISREIFNDVRDNPNKFPEWYTGYVLTIWSFGNNQRTYLFGEDNETIKKEAHDYLMANGYKTNYRLRLNLIKKFKNNRNIKDRFELEQLERLQRLQQLQQLERLQQLQQLERLTSLDWFDFIKSIPESILENSFIYCDPPYRNTSKYLFQKIDYDFFWNWFEKCPYPVYVSSYNAPPNIQPINKILKQSLFNPNSREKKVENIYYNKKGIFTATFYDLLFETKCLNLQKG